MKLRDTPCARCGWKFPGFHVCADLSSPCEGEAAKSSRQKEATSEYWQNRREANADRDADIVEQYKVGLSYAELADEFGLARHTIARIMRRAENNDEVVIRPQGSKARMIEEVSYGV